LPVSTIKKYKTAVADGLINQKLMHENSKWEIIKLTFNSYMDRKNMWNSWGVLLAKDNNENYFSFYNIPTGVSHHFYLRPPSSIYQCSLPDPDYVNDGHQITKDTFCMTSCAECTTADLSTEYFFYFDLKDQILNRVSTLNGVLLTDKSIDRLDYKIKHNEYIEDEHYYDICEDRGAASSYISVSRKYPEITGLKNLAIQQKVNKQLQQAAGFFEKEWDMPTTIKVTYEVMYQNNNVMSVKFYHNHMVCGARHDTGWYRTVNISLTTGDLYYFKDLFIPDYNKKIDSLFKKYFEVYLGESSDGMGRACDKKLSSLIKIDLVIADYDKLFCVYTLEDEEFTFDKKNLTLYFGMYEIGSAYIGSPEIIIPIEEIRDFYDPSGPLESVFKFQ